jgi:hypothetical protein
MDLRTRAKHVIASGFAFGLPKDQRFNINKPYTGCLICGAVFQGPLDLRVPPGHEPQNSLIAKLAQLKRKEWAEAHSKTHSDHERRMHRLSGRFATPEASQMLAAQGVFSVIDLVVDDEVSSALAEAKAIPIREIEGS